MLNFEDMPKELFEELKGMFVEECAKRGTKAEIQLSLGE